ncbi:MAG: SPOR domain-containing protein [Burkholderiales bacterium]|nr:SPOR domain-containing protein [Burkholderiales bacterium]
MPPTAPEDVNLDELRRRARRRLVGAIVLALVVAVAVPMLLESDPRPLGEDVSVKIPPIDEGKFVNRLAEKAKVEPMKAAAPKPAPPPEVAKAEPPPKPVSAEPAPPAASEPAPGTSPPAPDTAVAKAPATSPAPKEAPREPVAGEFAVQVFAFSDDKGANSLVRKLKDKGFPAYSEPLATSKGTLWRVRVGPFPTRETAVSAREKLKDEGYNGIVASAK